MTELSEPVLIVGAGPIGLIAAHLLQKRGVRALVAEKYERRLEAPKAHALNPRSLEICAAAGLPMDKIHSVATNPAEGAHVRFMTALTGVELGSIAYERQDDGVRAVTPWPLINIAQPDFEAVAENALQGADLVRVQRNLEWLGYDQVADAVISRLRDRTTGEDVRIRSKYLIAADGAGSVVREAAGIKMEGMHNLANNIMIHFEADLRTLVGDKPGILYFLFGEGIGSVMIAYDIGKTWVLMHPYDPQHMQLSDFTDDICRELIATAIGAQVDVAIKGTRTWTMSAEVASRYRSGNVFLAGDAAHRFPPTGGLGLNTGVGDIDNLTWKIAAVERGWAKPELLDSYEDERKYVAQSNMGQSLVNAMRIRQVYAALGQEMGEAFDVAQLAARLADPKLRSEIGTSIAAQAEHFDSLRLQLGYVYGAHRDDDAGTPINTYQPRVVAGARLPHARRSDGGSTLDLVDPNGFVLLTASAIWRDRSATLPAPIHCLVEGEDFALDEATFSSFAGLDPEGALLMRPDGHFLHIATSAQAGEVNAMALALQNYLQPR